MLDDTTHYGLLKTLEESPGLSQRDLAKRLGISLGKVNFCLNALVAKGSLKINNFRNSNNKLAYAYAVAISKPEKMELVENFHRFGKLKHSMVNPKAFTEKGLYMLVTIFKSTVATQATPRLSAEEHLLAVPLVSTLRSCWDER